MHGYFFPKLLSVTVTVVQLVLSIPLCVWQYTRGASVVLVILLQQEDKVESAAHLLFCHIYHNHVHHSHKQNRVHKSVY